MQLTHFLANHDSQRAELNYTELLKPLPSTVKYIKPTLIMLQAIQNNDLWWVLSKQQHVQGKPSFLRKKDEKNDSFKDKTDGSVR